MVTAHNPKTMRIFDADACFRCPLADRPGTRPCTRQRAQYCMWLSKPKRGEARVALGKLSRDLTDEARADERVWAVLTAD
jgi:hypothetical protein